MTTNKQALSVEDEWTRKTAESEDGAIVGVGCTAPELSDAEIRDQMLQIVLEVQSSTGVASRHAGYERIMDLLRTEAAYKRGKGGGITMSDQKAKTEKKWQDEMCVCGCCKQWHSLESSQYVPAASGCLSGTGCGCKGFTPASPKASEGEPAQEEIAGRDYDPCLDDLDDPASLVGLSLGVPFPKPAQDGAEKVSDEMEVALMNELEELLDRDPELPRDRVRAKLMVSLLNGHPSDAVDRYSRMYVHLARFVAARALPHLRQQQPAAAPAPQEADGMELRYLTSEQAQKLPLPLQLKRLEEINRKLCDTHNGMVIAGARQDEKLRAAEGEADALKSQVEELRIAYGLALSLHGCGGKNCTEAEYLKDAENLMTEVNALRERLAELEKGAAK